MNIIKEPPYRRKPRAVVNIIIFLIKRGELPPRRPGAAREESHSLSGPKRSADGRADEEPPLSDRGSKIRFPEAPPEQQFGHGLSEVGTIMGVSGVLVHLQCAIIPVNVRGGWEVSICDT